MDGFKTYEAEAQEKWGKTEAYKEHVKKTKHYSKDRWHQLAEEMDAIFAAFAVCKNSGKASDSPEAQSLVQRLQSHITDNYYHCTNEILSGLGQMYAADERFQNNIDKHAEGTAEFVRDAIKAFCAV